MKKVLLQLHLPFRRSFFTCCSMHVWLFFFSSAKQRQQQLWFRQKPERNTYGFVFNAVLVLTLLVGMPAASFGQSGKTFVVNTTGDEEDANAGEPGDDGQCDVDPATPGDQCTFRAAIQNHNANRHLDQNRIEFAITEANGTNSIVIMVGSSGLGPLPPILGSVHIQALNSATSATLPIELDGSMAGDGAIGLQLLGGHCKITWFIIHSFSSHGILISGTGPPGEGGHWLGNMRIGTNSSGDEDKGNGGDGIFIEDTPDNLIGGSDVLSDPNAPVSRGNLISGNGGYGIRIVGRDPDSTGRPTSGAANNLIEGNIIGLDNREQNVLTNDAGGVLIDNARNVVVGGLPDTTGGIAVQQQGVEKGNKVAGEKTGITITGSLAKGVRVEGNTVGQDGTTAKFLTGIFAQPGELFSAEGNILTNIGDVGLDLFFDANSRYVIKDNQIMGNVKTGSILKFSEDRVIEMLYEANIHRGNSTGLQIEEALKGTINWTLEDNIAENGGTGGSITFRAAGNKNLNNNHWDFNSGVGLKYASELSSNLSATVTVNGDFFVGNGEEGFSGRVELEAEADITLRMLKIVGSQNGKDGLSLGLGASASATGIFELGGESSFGFNAGLGVRLLGKDFSIDAFEVAVEKTTASDNVEGAFYFFGIKGRFSVTNNVIANNSGPGIRLGGNSEMRIANNIISGNTIGVLTEDQAFGSLSNNTLTGNGKAVVVSGGGTGFPLSGNLIFNNTGLGIDLNNDGVTPNDEGDADNGPNRLQNFPVLTHVVVSGSQATIQGTLNSTPNAVFRIEIFGSTACDPSGFGEGEIFLGFTEATTSAAGNAAFSTHLTLPSGIAVLTATATDGDNNSSEFSACLPVDGVVPQADLELSKQADKTQVTVGDSVAFTLTIANKGPDEATGIVVRDKAPAGFRFTSITASEGSYDTATGLWTLLSLSSGSQASLTIVAIATQAGTITNTAEITGSNQTDPDSAPDNNNPSEDDQSSTAIEVQEVVVTADLELTKSASKTTAFVGETVVVTIKLINKGPAAATNIVVTDVLSTDIPLNKFVFDQIVASAGVFQLSTATWMLHSLAAGSEATVTITGRVLQKGTLTNTAELTACDQSDPDSSPGNGAAGEDDQSSITIQIIPVPQVADLELTVTQNKRMVAIGETGSVTVKLVNKGPVAAAGIAVGAALNTAIHLKNISFTKVTTTAGRFHFSNARWQISRLLPGQEAVLTIAGNSSQAGTVKVIFEVIRSNRPDPDSSPNNGNPNEDDYGSVSFTVVVAAPSLTKKINPYEDGQKTLQLHPVAPNPFSGATVITFELARTARVQLAVFDANGRLVEQLANSKLPAGVHRINWQPRHLAAGVYLLRASGGGRVQTQRLVVLR